MSVDRTKVLEAAQKHLAKGNYDKAIAEFRRLVDADPNDVRTWLKIGDLYTRKGARREAIDIYARVAAQYGAQGFFLKAVAVYKQILKLDPSRLDVLRLLAEQYELLQLTSDALAAYERVASGYARAGDIDRALATLQKMTELDEENLPVRIKYAEALSKAGRTDDAADAFEAGAALLKSQGRIDDFIKVAERLQYHRPSDIELSRELAGLYLEREDPKRALSKLQLCFKADPKHVGTLELLAEAFNQLGQLPKTISVYREIARIHHEAKRQAERKRTLEKIVELDPGDAEAREALAGLTAGGSLRVDATRADIAPPASAVVDAAGGRESDPGPEIETDYDDVEVLEEAEIIVEEEVEVVEVDEVETFDVSETVEEVVEIEAPASAPAAPSVPPDVQREAQIARMLTECDVFMRYGLRAKVMEQLRAVIALEPTHVEARERLKDLYLAQGMTAEAMAELMQLAEILAEEESAASVLYLRQVLELDPDHAEAQARLAQLRVESIAPAAPPPAPPPDDDVIFLDDSTQADAGPPTDQMASAPRAAIPPPPAAALPDAPPKQAQVPKPGEVMDLLAPMSPREFEEVPLRPSSPGELAADVVRRSVAPGEVEELLDEADFFIAQGLLREARSQLRDALTLHPGNLLIEEKLREVDSMAPASDVPHIEEPPAPDQSFQLAEKLAEELDDDLDAHGVGGDVLDLDEVFAQFKKGVEQQVGMEDSETHFDLGIAYKEMGLLDDAIHEFQLCVRNPARVCIAETMIGLCYLEKGSFTEAIAHFKKGLYADTKTDREELGLYFELGNAYDLMRDPKEAIFYFQKVAKRDPTFRDVGRRLEALTRPEAVAPAASPMAPDDIDRAFDDLMGED